MLVETEHDTLTGRLTEMKLVVHTFEDQQALHALYVAIKERKRLFVEEEYGPVILQFEE